MTKCNNWPIAVCTWSLKNNFDMLSTLREQLSLTHIHLALSPALAENGQNYIEQVQKQNWDITATMIDFPQEDYSTLESIKATGGIVPDPYWQDNKKRVFDAVDITAGLNVKYLSLHFGFLDISDDESVGKFTERTKILADRAAGKNIQLLMETGQESAGHLREFLEQIHHPALAVNFDPANMILYDKGEPIEAVEILAAWIKHVHIKDALRTQTPGTWGAEVPWGDGQVGLDDFLDALGQAGFTGPLAVEREAGDKRFEDIKLAVQRLCEYSG
ncbi:MAG: sugar phosphate isomerase/epimerase family protein [Planctomycetota bacterium]|jgi:sugar phosphate isomerase/epimerase